MDFKFLKPWRLQLFIRPDIRRNLTDEKKTYTQPTHTHEIEKKNIPETDTQWNEKMKDESRQINVSCNDFDEKKKFCPYTLFSLKVSIPPKYYTICSTLSMMKHKYPPGQLMFLNRLN